MAVITIFSFFSVTKSFAQQEMQWRGGGGWGIGSPYGRMYDLKTKTDKEKISVHLGPGWYIENQDTKIEPKDKVEITGSRITLEGKPAIIAAEVKKGEEVLKLRDEKGFPLWSGWRRH